MAYSTVIENFLRYVKIDTQSKEECADKTPSTEKQRDLAALLQKELLDLGASNVRYDEAHAYVYAEIPSNPGAEQQAPAVGFIAHMDTSDAVSGADVKPRVIERYNGKDIVLNRELNIVTRVSDFPMLADCKGKSLIVTDGTTLLGGDDKAGVAEIMAMAEYFLTHPEEKHGKICIGFTPDEEVGHGVDFFDIKGFGADYAYTVDGGRLGELNYECFNAASAKLTIRGRSTHPGYAPGVMRNAARLVADFVGLLPKDYPEYTSGYQGFYHVHNIQATVEHAEAEFIIRDHDRKRFEERKETFAWTVRILNDRYKEELYTAEIKDQYYNMREILEDRLYIVDNAAEAMRRAGVAPDIVPIRGGTDGARLSFDGLPCPNICTGTEGHHGRNEFACVEDMETVVEILKNIVRIACE